MREDEPAQLARAQALLAAGPCFVSDPVLLETAWVLGATFKLRPREIVRQLRDLTEIDTLSVRDEPSVRAALDDIDAGVDIADAFHRALSPGASRLATFDRRSAEAVTGRPGVSVDLL